jgi:hypothetical protein
MPTPTSIPFPESVCPLEIEQIKTEVGLKRIRCYSCKRHRLEEEFERATFKGEDCLNPRCNRCRAYRAKPGKDRLERREWYDAQKRKPCLDCGKTFPMESMDFDHCHGEKEFNISIAWAWMNLDRLKAEIEKCELVCANCHRIRTDTRKQRTGRPTAPTNLAEADLLLELKKCNTCGTEKPLKYFSKMRVNNKLYTSHRCNPCRASQQLLGDHNKNRASWFKGQKNKPCADCKNTFPQSCMEFDHVTGTKKFILASAWRWADLKKLQKEIDKCQLVCCNCHRVRSKARKQSIGRPTLYLAKSEQDIKDAPTLTSSP